MQSNAHDRADAYLLRHLRRNEIIERLVDGRNIGTHAHDMLIGQLNIRNGFADSNCDLDVRLA